MGWLLYAVSYSCCFLTSSFMTACDLDFREMRFGGCEGSEATDRGRNAKNVRNFCVNKGHKKRTLLAIKDSLFKAKDWTIK